MFSISWLTFSAGLEPLPQNRALLDKNQHQQAGRDPPSHCIPHAGFGGAFALPFFCFSIKKGISLCWGAKRINPNTIIALLASFVVLRRCEISHFPQFYGYNIHMPDSRDAFLCCCSLSAALFKSFLTRIVIQHLSPLPSHTVVGGVLFV